MDEVERVLRLVDLEEEDGNSDKNEEGEGKWWYNNDAIDGKICDEEGQEEVDDDQGGEEK